MVVWRGDEVRLQIYGLRVAENEDKEEHNNQFKSPSHSLMKSCTIGVDYVGESMPPPVVC